MTPAALDPWDEDFDYEELLRIEQDAIRQVQQADEQMKLSQQEQRSEEEVMSLDGSDSDEDMIAEVEMEGTQTHALPPAGSDSEEEAQLEEPTQPQ
jgi:hypothetical protein